MNGYIEVTHQVFQVAALHVQVNPAIDVGASIILRLALGAQAPVPVAPRSNQEQSISLEPLEAVGPPRAAQNEHIRERFDDT